MGDSALPPSRFGAGYTAGAPTARAATGPPAYRGPSAAPAPGTNPLAIASFALALLFGPFLVVTSIPLALVARSQTGRSGDAGRALANAALIVSAVYALLGVVVAVLMLFVVR